ncbi:MAG: acyl--CoA ligase, partial [Actinobacteria bacterium]|nr:acyl--CoA ligase [Actinomycetota bacterium]
WFATGDMGTVDTEGRLQVTGRISEVINTGGEKVSPEQIEKILHNHSLVHEVAVIGVPDSEWGEKVVACVVPEYPDNPPSLQQLAELVKTALAPWAAPKELRIIDSFPKTSISKIDRKALKTIYTDKI